MTTTSAISSASSSTPTSIDKSLLRGLDPVMTRDEQAQLTALLVRGDPNCLSQACKIFHELEELLKLGIAHPNQRSVEQQTKISDSFRTSYVIRSSSKTSNKKHHPGYNNYEARVLEAKKQADLERKQLQHTLPLPVRMPRLVVLDAFDPDPQHAVHPDTALEETAKNDNNQTNKKKFFGIIPRPGRKQRSNRPTLTFVDSEWDGTIGLAFTKLTVKPNNGPVKATAKRIVQRIERKDSCGDLVHVDSEPVYPTSGYDAIVDRVGGYDAQIIHNDESTENEQQQQVQQPMVLIASTHNDASKLAIARGDVVTHVNGQEFVGTTEDLKMLIRLHYQDVMAGSELNNNKLEIVVNGELCVAKALQLRSLVQ
mmetsp:Transcript_20318/g.48337  ORF Transcript_20318/g.48337 Transcript_20318/m.48337 type:complete len:369 (+) Transcript_20318:339-1445(+)